MRSLIGEIAMKKSFVLFVCVMLCTSPAWAINWSDPVKVVPRPVMESSFGNIVAENGKVAIADAVPSAVGTWPQIRYNEYTYDTGGTGSLTRTATDLQLPGNVAGTYGTRIQGIGLDDGQPVIATLAWSAAGTNARVTTLQADGTFSQVDASTNAFYYGYANREAFRLDSADNAYLVYTASADDAANGILAEDIVLASAPGSTAATWTQTVLSRPALPFTTSTGASAAAKIAIDESGATPLVQTAYMADNSASPSNPSAVPGWFSADGTATYITGLLNGTTTSKCDIALDADGNPMVAAFGSSGVEVAFYDGVTPYTVSTVTAANILNVGWYNTSDHIDIEVDGQGRPVVIVTSVDDAYGITEAYMDYYVYEGGSWTGENLLTVSTTTYLRYPDLTFDESGRPFISFSGELDGSTDRDLYLMTDIDDGVPTVNPPAPGLAWGSWTQVDTVTDAGITQLAMATQGGKLGLTYQKASASGYSPRLLYTEYVYANDGILVQVQEEDIPGVCGAYGTRVRGLDYDSTGAAVVGAIGPIGNPTLDAFVLERLGSGLWSTDKADANSLQSPKESTYGEGGSPENFVLDPCDHGHFVWADSPGDTIFYGDKSSGSWVVSSMSTTGTLDGVRTAMALDGANNPHIAYSEDNSGTPAVFYTSDLVSGSFVIDSGTANPTVRQDIEILANGYPGIVSYNITSISLAMYNGTSWDTIPVVMGIDGRNYGWLGTGSYADLEVDPCDGNPVVVLAHLDNYDLGTDASAIVDYYKYQGYGIWTKETIGTFDSGGTFPGGIDLVFDEDGRPFVGVVINDAPGGDRDVYVLTTEFAGGPSVCGDLSTVYLDYDFNQDCYINVLDLPFIVQDWLKCSTPGGMGCEVPDAENLANDPNGIYPGSVTVDGDLSDWDSVAWIAMDKVYHDGLNGLDIDLSNARWAAKWDDTSNLIYVAVTGTDTYHYFSDTEIRWDGQDVIELYVDAADSDAWELSPDYVAAQQWVFGPDAGASPGEWGGGYWGNLGSDPCRPVGTLVDAAVDVTGDVISYEFAIPPYSTLSYSNPGSSVEVDLEAGLIVGLDVIMGTRASSASDPYDFAMLCENTIHGFPSGKWDDALSFQNYVIKAADSGLCGDWGYFGVDFDMDCVVDLKDFAEFASTWMQCSDPEVADCDQYWK